MFENKFDRALAVTVGGGFFLLGVGELVARLTEPMPLFFWLPTLWGGAALVLTGSFLGSQNQQLSKTLVILGAVLGFLPSAWTVLMPALIITLVVRTVTSSREPQTTTPD